MSKVEKSIFRCQQCGYESSRWLGRCPDCGEWNTMVEEIFKEVKNILFFRRKNAQSPYRLPKYV